MVNLSNFRYKRIGLNFLKKCKHGFVKFALHSTLGTSKSGKLAGRIKRIEQILQMESYKSNLSKIQI